MESYNHITFLCFLIFHFSIFTLPSSAYTIPDKYFINCGSAQNASVNGLIFIGDQNSGNSFTFSTSETTPVSATNPPLYQTSRIFRKTSSYELGIDQSGLYILRLHFYPPLNSSDDFFNASFNVSASERFQLLSNFSVEKNTQMPEIQEFLLRIEVGKFRIAFEPVQESSFAFITAIEVFLAPEDFVPDSAPHVLPGVGQNGDYNGILSDALHVVHRINVGGDTLIGYNNDTLGRNWIPDGGFLIFNVTAIQVQKPTLTPNYQHQGATEFNAPNQVYNTAKELDVGTESSSLFNLTWRFNVSKNVPHLVRAHFCDIVSDTLNENSFNLYIYGDYGKPIVPSVFGFELAAPFYVDFLVDSDDSGGMNIGIGHDKSLKPAFLNGVEIMELKGGGNSGSRSKKSLVVIVASVIGGSIVIIMLVVGLIFVLRRGKKKPNNPSVTQLVGVNTSNSYFDSTQRTSNHSPLQDLNLDLRLYFSDIVQATNNFNPKLIIGQGGFGKVYSGVLNGRKVAVKRSEIGHGQGLSEFHTEINLLSRLRHRHLVSLIGYCDEGSEMILVYEFMEKGTLREHLYEIVSPGNNQTSQSQLSWEKRLEICIGAANGLHYLHACLDGSIIHRDVKSTNILLDEEFTAKVSDFGLSKLGAPDQTHVSTAIKGSFGYYDPEYFTCMQLTQKSDVYSFGVVLLEVLCARQVINNGLPREQVNLAEWGVDRLKKGLLESILDPVLVGKINPNSLRKYGETFDKCLKDSGADRPSMLDVSWDLEYALRLQRPNRIIQGQNADSMTDVSVNLPSMVLDRFPSYSTPFSDIAMPEGSEDMDSSYTDASQVFSQLKMDKAR